MAEQPNQSPQTPPEEENEPAEVYSVSQDQDGSLHFSRRDFLFFSMAVGGTLLLKGVCPRFGADSASTTTQPVQAGMFPLPKVSLHARPSIESNIVDTLQQNDIVLLIGDHPDLGWVEVATSSGKQGWLKRAFVDFSRAFTKASRDFNFTSPLESYAKAFQSEITSTPTNTPPSARSLGPNLALGKTATASSVENNDTSGWGPQNAVDGDTVSRWSSAYSDPQWIQIDLGTITRIDQVRLIWEAAYAQAYQIQVSINGSSWTDIYTITSEDGGTDDLLNLTGFGRYIRMYATSRGTVYGYSLYEFEVYGAPVVLSYVYLPIIVNGSTPTPTNTPTETPTPTQTPTPTPCSCDTAIPNCNCNIGPCPCDTAIPNCNCNIGPCPCDTAIPNCNCNIGPCPCDIAVPSCYCNIGPCSCNSLPTCSCVTYIPCTCVYNFCTCNSLPTICTCHYIP